MMKTPYRRTAANAPISSSLIGFIASGVILRGFALILRESQKGTS